MDYREEICAAAEDLDNLMENLDSLMEDLRDDLDSGNEAVRPLLTRLTAAYDHLAEAAVLMEDRP